MRTTLILVLGLAVPCAAIAEDTLQSVKFEFGATLNAVLSDTVDARKVKPGDPVRAKTSEDLKAGETVVVPHGSKLVGHVTEAYPAPKKDAQARLGIEFDRAELKDGRRIALHTTFYALAAPAGAASAQSSSNNGGFGGGIGSSSSVGALMSSSSQTSSGDSDSSGTERDREENLKPSPGAVGGINGGTGMLYASSRGVFGLEDVTLEPNTAASGGTTVILANAKTVRLSSGTRMLLSVAPADNGTR